MILSNFEEKNKEKSYDSCLQGFIKMYFTLKVLQLNIPISVSESSYWLWKLSENKNVYSESPCLLLSMNFKEFYCKHNASEMHLLDFWNKATEECKTRLLFSGQVAGGDSVCPPQPKPGQDPICWLP